MLDADDEVAQLSTLPDELAVLVLCGCTLDALLVARGACHQLRRLYPRALRAAAWLERPGNRSELQTRLWADGSYVRAAPEPDQPRMLAQSVLLGRMSDQTPVED